MRQLNKQTFCLAIFFLFSYSTFGQIWPITPMVRFGNTVYYKLKEDQSIALHGSNIIYDKEIGNRFFDVLCKKDSVEIKIDGTVYFFEQKNRREPKQYKDILFYSRRILRNEKIVIKYMKLIKINKTSIKAKATIRYRYHIFRKKEIVEINRSDLKGLFLGPGKFHRFFVYASAWGGALIINYY